MAAACLSVPSPHSYLKRPPLTLTPRRLEANRRNAVRSTGPRTPKGKARVARNAIKHGFFADAERLTEQQHRDFAEIFAGLCDDFRPQSDQESLCVAVIADSYVRMAAMWRYEGVAALKYHQQCERELNDRIAAATPDDGARLKAHREELRRAGLWGPTIPGPREAAAIIRCEGRLNRAIRDATAELENLQALRASASHLKVEKQTHLTQQNREVFADSKPPSRGVGHRAEYREFAARDKSPTVARDNHESAKTNRCETSSSSVLSASRRTSAQRFDCELESAKTNPLNPASTCLKCPFQFSLDECIE